MEDEQEKIIEELVEHQRKRLLKLGRQFVPQLTPEDILQPNDYPILENSPLFRYEEGALQGLLSAKTALLSLKNNS